ncbi:hypothetical protein AA313_de0202293 [Arthrobotrys entomopaga]|nr:hypothetical protein AA313_de0202293 [Arthrobotrys entomopaga]
MPYQRDVPVFSNPAVPCVKSKWRTACAKREYLNTGCGLNTYFIDKYESTNPDPKKPWSKSGGKKPEWYYMAKYSDKKAFIPVTSEVTRMVARKSLPKATAGGWLKMMVHQINDDGAGPYRCRIDYNGNGDKWSKWIAVTKNVPGTKKSWSWWKAGDGKNYPLNVKIPAGAQCSGKYGGQSNICIIRCENWAKNGPFGGCIPFQLVPKHKPTPHVSVKTVKKVKTKVIHETKVVTQAGQSVTVTVGTTVTDTEEQPVSTTVTVTAQGSTDVPVQSSAIPTPQPTNNPNNDDGDDLGYGDFTAPTATATDGLEDNEAANATESADIPASTNDMDTAPMDPADAADNQAEEGY